MILTGLSALSALVYGAVYCWRDGSSLPKSAVKTAAIGALALHAFLSGAPAPLIVALGLSALGDLALSRPGDRPFMAGLAAFGAAHLAYVVLFWPTMMAPAPGIVFAIVLLALSTRQWLIPHSGDLRWSVMAYVLAITAMAITASGQPETIVVLGAALFLASDTMLAIQLFRLTPASRWHVPASVLLWALYYIGQYLIWRGIAG